MKTFSGFSIVVCIGVFVLQSCGGEKSICRKAYEVRNEKVISDCKELVSMEGCWQCLCLCYLEGKGPVVVLDEQGLIDLDLFHCMDEPPCYDYRRISAEECLADKEECQKGSLSLEEQLYGMDPCEPPFSDYADPDKCVL